MTDALESVDTIKVDTLVQEFFAQQSLKILPQAPFGDAVNQFVSKDDKHAVEMFVMDSLSTQVKGLLQLDDEKITEGLDAHIEDFRKVMEKSFVTGQEKQAQRRRRFKPKPDGWDSDRDGHWTAQPDVIEEVPPSPEPDVTRGPSRSGPASGVTFSDDDDDLFGEEPAPKQPAKRQAATRTTTKRAAPAKKAAAPAKKTAAPKKAPARNRKRANPFANSDDDGEGQDEDDVIMDDDDVEPPPPPPPPKPTRATRGAAKAKQTTLNFSQSQRSAKQSQKAIEISDDEISDDAFESMPATRSRRR